jgi:hypothetical protein
MGSTVEKLETARDKLAAASCRRLAINKRRRREYGRPEMLPNKNRRPAGRMLVTAVGTAVEAVGWLAHDSVHRGRRAKSRSRPSCVGEERRHFGLSLAQSACVAVKGRRRGSSHEKYLRSGAPRIASLARG